MTIIFAFISFLIIYKLFKTFGRVTIPQNVRSFEEMFREKIISVQNTGDKISEEMLKLQSVFPEYQTKNLQQELEIIFDTVFNAFASSRHEALKNLLSPEVYESFAEQISKRELKNLRQEVEIKHLSTVIEKINISNNKRVTLSVLLNVSQMSAIVNSDGMSYDNPNKIYINVSHRWVFERHPDDANSWKLIKNTVIV